jgi:uncharacterized protein
MVTMRLVFDTNVLIDGFQDDFSAQARLIDAVCAGKATALATAAIKHEYRKILDRLIDNPDYREKVGRFFSAVETVQPKQIQIVIDDQEDMKFLQAAVGGQADVLVTSDRHLLDVGELDGVAVVAPTEAWNRFEDQTGGSSQWQDIVKGLGIGR